MQTIKNTIAENFGGPAHSLAPKEHQFELEQTPSLTDKVAVITGGSEGIGYGCTHTLLSHDVAKLFILSVSKVVADGALKAISEEMGAAASEKVTWYKCDISNWREVKETADKIAKNTDRIDILINCAARGIMSYQLTDYGVDRHMGGLSLPITLFTYTKLETNIEKSNSSQPHGSCHSHIPPPPPNEENRIKWQYSPNRESRLQRPPSHTKRL